MVIEVARQNATNDNVEQLLHPCETGRKHALLAHLIRTHDMPQVIVFTRTKQNADQLARNLKRDGFFRWKQFTVTVTNARAWKRWRRSRKTASR